MTVMYGNFIRWLFNQTCKAKELGKAWSKILKSKSVYAED